MQKKKVLCGFDCACTRALARRWHCGDGSDQHPGAPAVQRRHQQPSRARRVQGSPVVPPDDGANPGDEQDAGHHQQHHCTCTQDNTHVSAAGTAAVLTTTGSIKRENNDASVGAPEEDRTRFTQDF